jgi:hypothetical protein
MFISQMIWSHGEIILIEENRRTLKKTYPVATFSITNPSWADLDANPGFRGESPAINCLSFVTANFAFCTYGVYMFLTANKD